MPRLQTLFNIVLLAIVLVQAWMLHGRHAPDGRIGDRADATAGEEARPAAPSADPLAMAVMDRLQGIDARLAALESRQPPVHAVPASPATEPLDPRSFAEADRRLAALLPDRDLDAHDWGHWQATLAALPPAEQHAVSAAFARAVNADRIRLRF